MNKLHFTIIINAWPEDLWNTLLSPDTYRVWTAEFAEGSYFEGSWWRPLARIGVGGRRGSADERSEKLS